MMKICQKKDASVEDETVLVQLERRHTLKEDTNEVDLEDNLRKTIRANSLGSFEEGNSSTDIEAVTTKKQTRCTRKPTVITESELSSSWLYKDRKAKINSDDESIEDPTSTRPPENHEDFEPRTLQDPNLKPVPVSNQRPRKMSSCCWYFAIFLLICIACLAVMAGIGGIVFMEFFATYEVPNTDTFVKNDKNPSASKEIFPHSSHKQDNSHRNEPKIPVNILKEFIKNSTLFSLDTDASRKVTVTTSQPEKDIFHSQELTNSKGNKTTELNKIKRNFVFENQGIEKTEHPKTVHHSDISRNIHDRINNFNAPVSDKFVEIKTNAENQDSFDLKLNYQSINHIMNKISDGHAYESNKQMVENESIIEKKLNSEAEILNASEEIFQPERNFNEKTSLEDFESKTEQVNSDMSFQSLPKQNRIESSVHLLPNGNSLGHMKIAIDDNHEDNSFDHRKHSIDHNLKEDSLDHAEFFIDPSFKNNSLDLVEHSIDHSPKNNSSDLFEYSFDHNDKSLNDHNEDSRDFDFGESSPEEHSMADDHIKNSNDSAQLVFIRPVVESKAIPVPLTFLRRIGFDIKNPNSHQPMTAKDMDIKFSLAEALKYLRSLDADNKLPASREKTVTRETISQKESKKLPLITEREEYLNTLRKQIFEESM